MKSTFFILQVHTYRCRKYDKDHSLKLEQDELKAFLAELNGGRAPKASSRLMMREACLAPSITLLSSRYHGTMSHKPTRNHADADEASILVTVPAQDHEVAAIMAEAAAEDGLSKVQFMLAVSLWHDRPPRPQLCTPHRPQRSCEPSEASAARAPLALARPA
jgi:hypothetical protein